MCVSVTSNLLTLRHRLILFNSPSWSARDVLLAEVMTLSLFIPLEGFPGLDLPPVWHPGVWGKVSVVFTWTLTRRETRKWTRLRMRLSSDERRKSADCRRRWRRNGEHMRMIKKTLDFYFITILPQECWTRLFMIMKDVSPSPLFVHHLFKPR